MFDSCWGGAGRGVEKSWATGEFIIFWVNWLEKMFMSDGFIASGSFMSKPMLMPFW